MYMFNKHWLVIEWRNSYILFLIDLGIILILALGFYSGLSGIVRTVYHFSLCVVSLLSSKFTASALVWSSNIHNNNNNNNIIFISQTA
jgi:hypothetical protein